jgi:uncharacterized protein (TIGR00369 family)
MQCQSRESHWDSRVKHGHRAVGSTRSTSTVETVALTRELDDAAVRERIQASFAKQGLMATLGASLVNVAPGLVEIAIRPVPAISQQHGFVHAGAVSAIADTAAGYAALRLMPPDTGVLTTEFKINLVSPAAGDLIVARGKAGEGGPDAHARSDGGVRHHWWTREAHCTPDRNPDGDRSP